MSILIHIIVLSFVAILTYYDVQAYKYVLERDYDFVKGILPYLPLGGFYIYLKYKRREGTVCKMQNR